MSNFVFFHNPDEENGYLSNWYLSDFIYNGVKFSSMEQFMMYRKALLFNDNLNAHRILRTNDVTEIKRMGREVHGFSDEIWNTSKERIVEEGLYCKFSQNQELLNRLRSTGTAILAECAVKDRVWGIGLSMKDPNRFDISKWRGENLLGNCLMTVRLLLGNTNK